MTVNGLDSPEDHDHSAAAHYLAPLAAHRISPERSARPDSATWLVLRRQVKPLSSASSPPNWGLLVTGPTPASPAAGGSVPKSGPSTEPAG